MPKLRLRCSKKVGRIDDLTLGFNLEKINNVRRQSILPKDPKPKMQSSTRLIPYERSRHRYLRNTSAVTKRQTAVQYPHHMTPRRAYASVAHGGTKSILPMRPQRNGSH